MYDNVPQEFIPEDVNDRIYPDPEIDYVHNVDEFNATREILERGVEEGHAERTAVHSTETDETLTYDDVLDRVDRLAGALQEIGVEYGDRVLWRFGDVPTALVSQMALWKIGAVNVPCIPAERAREIQYYLDDTEATAVLTADADFGEVESALENNDTVEHVLVSGDVDGDYRQLEDALAGASSPEAVATGPEDVASIFYTGGTTGRPKGCISTHAAEVAITDLEAGRGRAIEPDDVMFAPIPAAHAFGNGEKTMFPFRFWASTVLAERPPIDRVFEIVEEFGVTILSLSPTHLRMAMNELDVSALDLSSLRLLNVSGEILDEGTYTRWLEQTGVDMCNIYGNSAIRHAFCTPYRDGEKFAPDRSIGKVYAGFETKLVDLQDKHEEVGPGEQGQMAIRGPSTTTYWNNIHPDMPEKGTIDSVDGWYLLDDVVEKDEDGNVYFGTRVDNMIVTGGRQIAAPDVEEVLSEHSAVREVGVVGTPDETRGEVVKAFVAVTDDHEPGDELTEELQQFAKDNMAPYKYPREIEYMDELPKDGVGKIQRAELRDRE